MARIVAGQAQDYSELEDGKPYTLIVAGIEAADQSSGPSDFGPATMFTFAFDAIPDLTIRAYAGNRIGERKGGKASKLRQIIAAITNHPQSQAIEWFDDATFEVKYPGEEPVELRVGDVLVGRGAFEERPDGSQAYRLDAFKPVAITATATAPKARAAVATQSDAAF